eukprot:scaffold12212_cov122-Isochrysis_galbana.AAC.7
MTQERSRGEHKRKTGGWVRASHTCPRYHDRAMTAGGVSEGWESEYVRRARGGASCFFSRLGERRRATETEIESREPAHRDYMIPERQSLATRV